jgi:hypothetical protein
MFVRDDPDCTAVLLVTSYESLTSWQRSRQFPEGARKAFKQRGTFTLGTIAYATRLLPP